MLATDAVQLLNSAPQVGNSLTDEYHPDKTPPVEIPQVLSRSLVVGQSANILTDTTLPAKMGFALYDGPAGMLNCHFAGFELPGFQAIRVGAGG
jgi:hypothetical protein